MTPPAVSLRPAAATDRLALWRWRNDPETRRASFDQSAISLEDHTRWFEQSLGRSDRWLWIVQADGADAGTVRLDLQNGEATVSINVAPEWRRRGVGVGALRALTHEAFRVPGIARLVAEVKRDNAASRAVFAGAGYTVARDSDPLVMTRTDRLRVVAGVQARLRSARLPGKVLLPVAGRPLLGWIVARLHHAKEVDAIVISTTTAPADAAIEALAHEAGVGCFRGSEEDVADRLLGTARQAGADALVRITADCPLVDPGVVDRVTRAFRDSRGELEYACNVFPSTFPHGLDVEVLSLGLLERLVREIDDVFFRDWFSAFIREHPERFAMANIVHVPDLHELRWTVDYPEDLRFVEQVFRELGEGGESAGLAEIAAILERRPELREINRHLEDSAIIRGIRSATYHRLIAERSRGAGADRARPPAAERSVEAGS